MAKKGLYYNINQRKKKGISRPKSKSTISKDAYKRMKEGFKKKKWLYLDTHLESGKGELYNINFVGQL